MMKGRGRISLKSLLAMAVKAEIEANKIYSRLAKKMKNLLLKEKFNILAFEEKKHRTILENLFSSLYPKDTLLIPEETNAKLLPSVHFTAKSSLGETLYQAMISEKAAQDFYANLARRMKAKNKRVLLYLSDVEKSHFLMLKSEYTLSLQFEDYAESDIDKIVT